VPVPVEYAVDANVILRFVLGDVPALSRKAQAAFKAVDNGDVALRCDPVNLDPTTRSRARISPGR